MIYRGGRKYVPTWDFPDCEPGNARGGRGSIWYV